MPYKAFTHFHVYTLLIVLSLGLKTILLYLGMEQYVFVAYLITGYVFIASTITYLASLHRHIHHYILWPVTYILLLFNQIELFLYFKFHNYITADTIGIFLDTNPNEAKEFLASYVPWWSFLGLIIPVIIIFLCEQGCKLKFESKIAQWIGCFIFAVSALAFVHNPAPFNYGDNIMSTYIFKPSEHVDLTKHLSHPKVFETTDQHPQNIILIIGESFARNHSSLYGYEKKTNPELERLAQDSSLYIFTDVTSPALITKECFKYILNTFTADEVNDTTKWYNQTTIIEALKTVGYKTYWVSNQEREGVTADNLPASYSALCDSVFFNDKTKTKYDEFLLSFQLPETRNKNLVIYHMMGQHPAYRERYPKEFEHFQTKDYLSHSEHQRDTRAAYDNACLYNDHIVRNLIERYANKDAIVLYFSDHGFDVYESNPNLCGHANVNDSVSLKIGKEIPFAIYMSNICKELHPKIQVDTQSLSRMEFCTDRIIYMVLDICGYQLTGQARL